MIKAVIFDLDGVIVTTDELHYEAWKKIADQENIYFDKKINNRLRGVSRMESLEIVLERANKKYTESDKIKLATQKNDYYVSLLDSLSQDDILPNVLFILEELKKRSIKIAIGSSSKNAKKILKQIKLDDMFDEIADGNDITKSKPAPDVFLVAANKLSIEPTYCLVVEDAVAGIEAAKNANMVAVAISDATKSPLADFRLQSITELLNYI